MTLTYIYADSTAVLGPLATFSEPHSYDLCVSHGQRLTVPQGWNVIRQEINQDVSGPTDDDLMVIADAVREAASTNTTDESSSTNSNVQSNIGRRGHLRAVPTNY
jgi:hypothetical protein